MYVFIELLLFICNMAKVVQSNASERDFIIFFYICIFELYLSY